MLGKRKWMIPALAGVVLLVAYAWVDGGTETVHEISQELPMPKGPQ